VIERTIVIAIVVVIVLSMLASVLPRVTSSLVALGVVALVARVVWWYTR
jgi:hypothetical protein